jgi:hypothetical protein
MCLYGPQGSEAKI